MKESRKKLNKIRHQFLVAGPETKVPEVTLSVKKSIKAKKE